MGRITRRELELLVRQQAETITRLEAENANLREQLEVLHFRVSQMSRRMYGSVSERVVDPGQQLIPGLFPDGAAFSADDSAVHDDDPDGDDDGGGGPPTGKPATKQRRQRGGRLALPEHLPRVDRVIEPDTEALQRHPQADRLVQLREEITEKLDYVAGGFQVLRLIRPVYGIPHSDEVTVTTPPPPQVVARGLPTDRTVAMVLAEKFDLHNPLYRQQGRFQRAGIMLPRSTLNNWVAAATTHLQPIIDALTNEIHASPVIGLDDTVIKRLAPGTGSTHTARFWGYQSPTACVVTYADNRSGSHPQRFLQAYSGTIVADAYSGHEGLYQDGSKHHIPCMAHIRRKFVEAWRDAKDQRAKPVIDRLRMLYDLEKRLRGQPPDRITERRQREAASILDQLHHIVHQLSTQTTPKHPLGVACTYFLNRWPRLHRYLADGRFPIDNNDLERLWKPVALGRKNYLFVGNEAGGQRAACAYSITLSCRLNHIDPYHYLCDVFDELHHGHKPPHVLTPAQWAKNNQQLTQAA